MHARVKLIEGVSWLATADSGHGLVLDGSPDIGGKNLGPRPMELILQGLAGCTAMDVIHILRKARQAVTDCEIEVKAQRAESIPRVFTRIELRYIFTGHNLDPARVEHAVRLSSETYCSVSKMLEASVQIEHSIEIREAPAAP